MTKFPSCEFDLAKRERTGVTARECTGVTDKVTIKFENGNRNNLLPLTRVSPKEPNEIGIENRIDIPSNSSSVFEKNHKIIPSKVKNATGQSFAQRRSIFAKLMDFVVDILATSAVMVTAFFSVGCASALSKAFEALQIRKFHADDIEVTIKDVENLDAPVDHKKDTYIVREMSEKEYQDFKNLKASVDHKKVDNSKRSLNEKIKYIQDPVWI